jgi:glycerophosphoryl diester phosphodiesterase
MVQLIDADDYNLKAGTLTYAPPYDRPYDWTKAGDTRLFNVMVSPAGLAEIKTYADGIGPWKPYIFPVKAALDSAGNPKDINNDGKIDLNDAFTDSVTTLVGAAHNEGLFVHAYTFRSEKRRLTADLIGDPEQEYKNFYRVGVDGVFTDFPDVALSALRAYFGELAK